MRRRTSMPVLADPVWWSRPAGRPGSALRVLVDCVREHPIEEAVPALAGYVGRRGVAPLHDLAIRHGVIGCLWTALRAGGLDGRPDTGPTREAYTAALGRHLRTLSDLDLVLDVLAGFNVTPLVMKGPVLAELVYRRPDLRGYVDLDLLVPATEFPLALSGLERAGCTVYERNWPLVRDRRLGALRLTTPAGGVLDLHWHIFYEHAVRAAMPVDVAVLRERARTVLLGGRQVRTLDPLDTLAHVAVHAALDGGDRLVWLKDIEQALLYRAVPDWEALAERAGQWHAAPGIALMLHRARRVLGAPVPGAVLGQLVPDRAWRGLVRGSDAVPPLSAGRASLGRAVARAARSDGPASRRELARRATAFLHGRDRERFDPDDPESAAYPAGGAAERNAYLDDVRHGR
ncbi:MAG: nucleotidyltransferase family protein [Actinobacteria bacterium]|nr:nucleotidyltransferase family protein [Actinomycetota bacterium]MBI3686607.1 nucleotidyltransferase family protein [Actinomycetota bacterium]